MNEVSCSALLHPDPTASPSSCSHWEQQLVHSKYIIKSAVGDLVAFFLPVFPALSNPRRKILVDLLLLVGDSDFFFPPLGYICDGCFVSQLDHVCQSSPAAEKLFRLQQSDF